MAFPAKLGPQFLLFISIFPSQVGSSGPCFSFWPTAGDLQGRWPTWDGRCEIKFGHRNLEIMGRRSSPGDGDATGSKHFPTLLESNIIYALNLKHRRILQTLQLPRKFIGLENVGHLLSENMRHVFEMLCEESYASFLFRIPTIFNYF